MNINFKENKMDKRIKISSYLILALVLCLCSVTAFAATSSTSVVFGTYSSTATARTLTNGDTLTGYVKSTAQNAASGSNLYGQMYTRGSVFTYCRRTASVWNGTTNFSSYTCNDDGTFWVKVYGYDIHNGSGSVSN